MTSPSLADHACIRHRFASGVTVDWEFIRGKEIVRVKPGGPLTANSIEMELAAAVAGLGVIFTFEDTLRGALEKGELAPVLPEWWQSFPGLYLYYSSRRHMPAAPRAFAGFIRREA